MTSTHIHTHTLSLSHTHTHERDEYTQHTNTHRRALSDEYTHTHTHTHTRALIDESSLRAASGAEGETSSARRTGHTPSRRERPGKILVSPMALGSDAATMASPKAMW